METTNNPRVGVGVFIMKDGRFLMGLRKGEHGKDTWSVPGGHVEFGETLEETSVREVMEETNLEIDNLSFGAITNDIFKETGKHYLTIWMLSNHKSGIPRVMEKDKFIKLDWFDFNTLPSPLFLPWEELLKSPFIDSIKQKLEESRQKID